MVTGMAANFEDYQRRPRPELSGNELCVYSRQQNRTQRETAAKNDQKQAEDLIPQVAAVFRDTPGPV